MHVGKRGGTEICNALLYAITMLRGQENSLHCIIAFTDGYDGSSESEMRGVINTAKSANSPIFMIGIDNISKSMIEPIATETGGLYIEISDPSGLKRVYSRISELLNNSLIIRFNTAAKSGDQFKVKARVELDMGKS
jgi:hypothetical protein